MIQLFYSDRAQLGHWVLVQASEMPASYRRLLAHDHHMTVTVEEFHGCPVDLEVLQEAEEPSGDFYSRKILLRRSTDRAIVQFGIVRLSMALIATGVAAEIRQGEKPLGRVLIEHEVMRQVKLSRLWKIAPAGELAEAFPTASDGACFGRTALIYCDAQPAIELLEIVVDH